jgi:hypothetical protein
MVVGLREGNVQNKCANFSTITFGKNLENITVSTACQLTARIFTKLSGAEVTSLLLCLLSKAPQ